ncbi:MAG: hypothetical protein IK128_06340 [Clostridiales bacterium]|nr:hypothetical protein [Clostridiales bacterium]
MTWLVKLIMFICIVPSVIAMYALAFPASPEKKKMIFGVRNNPKFFEGDTAKKTKDIIASCRKGGLIITVLVCLASIVLLALPANGVTMVAWIVLVFALFLVSVPYAKGNTELKNLKKELGITKSGVVYTDLTNTNVVHSLKMPWLILPNAIALAATIGALLIDLGVIGITPAAGQYALTAMSLSFLFIAVLLIPLAIMMDNARNMVISRDSNVNANYSRAKKKTWADLFTAMSWANALFLVGFAILLVFVNNDIVMLCGLLAYMVIIFTIVFIGIANQKAVENRYDRDTDFELQDDDDNWVLGMFYYNPNDTRLNVEKRLGYGGTVNIAHPAGKVIMIASLLLVVFSIVLIIWLAATGQINETNLISVPGLS